MIDQFNKKICQWVSYFTLLMVLLTTLIVILRYAFGLGWVALQESVIYLHACALLLGSAYTLRGDGHVRVDIFYRQMSARRQALVTLVGSVLFALPTLGLMLVMSWTYVLNSWAIFEGSMQTGGIPLLFLFKTLIWLFVLSMILQVISEAIKAWCTLRGAR